MYFTYLVCWSKTGMKYYGVRYKDNISEDSMMTTYFTSSKRVHEYISNHGIPDVIQIRKRFVSKVLAKNWEDRVLTRMRCNERTDYLNLSNNNSFKDTVMTDKIKSVISEKRKEQERNKKMVYYTNGVKNIRIDVLTKEIPEGFYAGRTQSDKMKKYYSNMKQHVNEYINSLSNDDKKLLSEKKSIALKGKKKPEGFGEKISKSLKGRNNHWAEGDKNVSKREDVRKKISESWKNREIGIWYTDGVKNYYVKPSTTIDLSGLRRGRVCVKNK